MSDTRKVLCISLSSSISVESNPSKEAIFEVFLSSESDLSVGEIVQLAKVSNPTASKYVAVLAAEGKIVFTRKVGRSIFYAPPRDGSKTGQGIGTKRRRAPQSP